MSYNEFLGKIDKFVGHVVEFTFQCKYDGKTRKSQRYVWDNKEFGKQKPDCLIEVINVEDLGERSTTRIERFGITAV